MPPVEMVLLCLAVLFLMMTSEQVLSIEDRDMMTVMRNETPKLLEMIMSRISKSLVTMTMQFTSQSR